MKFLFLCVLVPALAMGGVTKSPLDETFKEFLESNHEYVAHGEQYEAEKAAFEKHQKHAINNNADASSTHTETLYPGFSELTDEEFAAAHLGGMVPVASIEESRARGGIPDPESLRNDPVEYDKFIELKARLESRQIEERTPASYSAVDNGLVSAVKHQGSCGSCAAFAATAAFETCMLKAGASKAEMDLSEQWLLNCAYQTKDYPQIQIGDGSPSVNGCQGAVAYVYGLWFKDNGGQAPHERSQTYTSGSSKTVEACNKSLTKYNSGAKVSNVVYAHSCDTQTLKQMIHQKGHAMISLFASEPQFENYRSGVLSTCSNNRGTNHAVLAVGYGTENGQDYWLVKNSWGTNWGENGYIKVKMGSCGIDSTGCTVSECTGTGNAGPAPPKPKPPPASQTCDLSSWFGDQLNGYEGTLNLNINWTHYSTKVKCTGNSKCQCLEKLKRGQNCCQAACGMKKCPPSDWY